MRKRLFSVLIIINLMGILFYGCNEQDIDTIEEDIKNDPHFVSEALVKEIVLNLDFEEGGIPTRSNSLLQNKKQIKGIADIKNEKSETSMYVTNYQGGGYVIISADNRLFPVLAYSENGYFDTDNADYPGGLLIWMEEIQEQIQYLKENSIPQEEGIQYQWNKLSGIEKIKTRENDQDLPPEEEQTYRTIGPLVETRWHQGHPYNGMMPAKSAECACCDTCRKAVTGCTTLAVAQILRYHRHPSNYQWGQMPLTGATNYTQSLMMGIHNFIKMTTSIDYKCGKTSVDPGYNIPALLKNNFKYKDAAMGNYDVDVVVRNVFGRKPVILRAQQKTGLFSSTGHAWVCSGAREYTYPVGGMIYKTIHLYMTWGWGDESDTWYLASAFNPDGYNFDRDKRMVYNITP